jgi:hypothetical protein
VQALDVHFIHFKVSPTKISRMWIKLFGLIVIACEAAQHPQQTSEFLELSKTEYVATGQPVVYLNSDNYKKFVVEKPKKYNLIVLYTANVQICRICKPFQDTFERVAASYNAADKLMKTDDELPIIFAVADIGINNEIARLHNMNTLPHIALVNGERSDISRLPTGILVLPPVKFGLTKLDVGAQEVLDWVNRETKQDVALYYTQFEKLSRLAFILAIITSVIVLAVKLVLLCRRKPSVISLVALVIYYISTSGIFYNLLHGMQWAGMNQDGSIQFLFQGARGQFLGEGLCMSGLTVVSGVSLFLAARLPYSDFAKRADANALATRLILLIGLSAACLYIVIGAYVTKQGWYSDGSMRPPPHYRRGPLRIDQGNTY